MSWEAALEKNNELTGKDEGFYLSHQVCSIYFRVDFTFLGVLLCYKITTSKLYILLYKRICILTGSTGQIFSLNPYKDLNFNRKKPSRADVKLFNNRKLNRFKHNKLTTEKYYRMYVSMSLHLT